MPLFNDFFPPHVIAFTGDRSMDFTFPPGRKVFNQEQKDYLSSSLKVDLPEPVCIRQVHGNHILLVDHDMENGFPEADGLLTKEAQRPLAIRTADCLPVFLYDTKQEGIGLVHAGWRGAQKNIIQCALTLMLRQWHTEPQNILVILGPAIRPCCYEVGVEFRRYFPQEARVRDGKHYLDLPQVIRRQLTAWGVPERNVRDCGVCTCCDKSYFSYRREGKRAGRMISLIMKEV
jgi:YfiH family protein